MPHVENQYALAINIKKHSVVSNAKALFAQFGVDERLRESKRIPLWSIELRLLNNPALTLLIQARQLACRRSGEDKLLRNPLIPA